MEKGRGEKRISLDLGSVKFVFFSKQRKFINQQKFILAFIQGSNYSNFLSSSVHLHGSSSKI